VEQNTNVEGDSSHMQTTQTSTASHPTRALSSGHPGGDKRNRLVEGAPSHSLVRLCLRLLFACLRCLLFYYTLQVPTLSLCLSFSLSLSLCLSFSFSLSFSVPPPTRLKSRAPGYRVIKTHGWLIFASHFLQTSPLLISGQFVERPPCVMRYNFRKRVL